jgi:hypothetical protein
VAWPGAPAKGRPGVVTALPDPTNDPDALRVCKRPEPLKVVFEPADGICQTLEGPVRYRAGDPILTGNQGERWPVQRDLFLTSYEPVPPTRPGTDGLYRKRPSEVLALRLSHTISVPVGWQDDPLQGRPGDWLLRYANSTYGIVQDAIFRESYGPAPGEERWPPPP